MEHAYSNSPLCQKGRYDDKQEYPDEDLAISGARKATFEARFRDSFANEQLLGNDEEPPAINSEQEGEIFVEPHPTKTRDQADAEADSNDASENQSAGER